jgi:rRNA maturation endonuclease Nob1
MFGFLLKRWKGVGLVLGIIIFLLAVLGVNSTYLRCGHCHRLIEEQKDSCPYCGAPI